MSFRRSLVLTCALLAGVWSAPPLARAQDREPLAVVATVGMIGDLAGEIGGSCVAVHTLMGPGVDPHLYRASARDVGTLGAADLILYSGYSLEGQLGEVLERLADRRPTVAVSERAIAQERLIRTGGPYGVDPHLWMDASLWALSVPVIAQSLAEARPDCAGPIAANAERLQGEIEALHGWVKAAVATIPERQRVLVTAHDAFNYYGRAYAIAIAGIQGISTQAEAGIADIRRTAARVAELGVPAIFVESTINPRTVQAVVDAASQNGQAVRIGGELYSDAMGEAGTPAGTYLGMIHANTATIVEALGGTLPPLPEALNGWAARWGIDPAAPALR